MKARKIFWLITIVLTFLGGVYLGNLYFSNEKASRNVYTLGNIHYDEMPNEPSLKIQNPFERLSKSQFIEKYLELEDCKFTSAYFLRVLKLSGDIRSKLMYYSFHVFCDTYVRTYVAFLAFHGRLKFLTTKLTFI